MILGTVLFFHCATLAWDGTNFVRDGVDLWEESLASLSPESLELQALVDRARERYSSVPEEQLAPRVLMNVQFIYRNKLNRARFVVPPPADSVVNRINTILDLSEELDHLVRTGRKFLGREQRTEQYEELVREIGKTAGALRGSFEHFFVEGAASAYSFKYPRVQQISVQFTHFILQSETINNDLAERLDEFFFGPSPGAIVLAEYERHSIIVLSEALYRLSRLAEEWIPDSGELR